MLLTYFFNSLKDMSLLDANLNGFHLNQFVRNLCPMMIVQFFYESNFDTSKNIDVSS